MGKDVEKKIGKKPNATSEIDDIFATKKLPPKKDVDNKEDASKKKEKKKKKKVTFDKEAKVKDGSSKDKTEDKEDQGSNVEEIVFADIMAAKSGMKRPQPPPPTADDDGFGDSRGKRAKRTTEEGYPLYDIKDLRIGEGKDTPLCPFDCDCCF
ncbi:hypothetical protein BX666DRAFT_1876775 [Dichotomocladium elegans]|nr:hypothetical protein BX666DRAFT_1876775 [Dichotomocladium elegans]